MSDVAMMLSALTLRAVHYNPEAAKGCERELVFQSRQGEMIVCYWSQGQPVLHIGADYDVLSKLGSRAEHRGMKVLWLKKPKFIAPSRVCSKSDPSNCEICGGSGVVPGGPAGYKLCDCVTGSLSALKVALEELRR